MDSSKGRPDGSHGARLSQYPVIAKCDRIMDQDESSESDSTRETVQDGKSRTQRERHPSHAVHVHEENLMMAKEIVVSIVAILWHLHEADGLKRHYSGMVLVWKSNG